MRGACGHLSLEPRLDGLQNRATVRLFTQTQHLEEDGLLECPKHVCHNNYIVVIGRAPSNLDLWCQSGARQFVARLGDPARPFFVDASRFPSATPWPEALRISADEAGSLADHIDAVLYLGPEPDRDLRGALPLSSSEKDELARRASIVSDPRRAMESRFRGRDQWFRGHPGDLPARF
jgi:hypothetical protein